MSSDISNPSLLIVSNQVYVRREDGRHYPALIKSKQGDGYIVQFANEARRQVLEDDLVWLGFWGLPTRCWPRHPTIQTAIASSKTFEGKVRFVGNRTTEERRGPVSFTIRETCGNEKYSTESNYSTKRSSSEGQRCCPERNTQTLARPLAEQGESQPRSSVLRLNKELLHKENSSVTFNASTSSKLTNARDASPRPIQSVPELVEKDPKLNKSSAENGSRTSNLETNEQEGARLSLSGESLKYQRRGEQLSLNQDTQWYTRDWTETFPLNQSSLSPPITPSSSSGCLSPEPPMFGAIYQTLANKEFSTENSGLFHDGQVRKKKSRNDAKKCRKVYGVENRHSWCTQCKWKKACTRFKE